MKYFFTILSILFCTDLILAQDVLWASKIIQFSSQFGDKAYSAQQVLGPPNALPTYGKSMVAWAPDIKSSQASITVEFDRSIRVQQIAIGENLLAGSIEKVYLYDQFGKEHLVYNNSNPQPKIPDVADIFNIYIPLTPYSSNRLRLDINFSNFRNIPQIDCIGISSQKNRIEARINTIDYGSFVPNPENLGSNVNSPYNDMLPIISPDGNTLYFARKYAPENMGVEKKDDIYISQKLNANTWSKAQNIGSPLNTDEHNFVCAISPDGNTMYLANRYDYRTEGQRVAVSYRNDKGKWSKPSALNIVNMYNKSKYACYHLSIDEKVMVMAIERNDTYGDMDLYVSFRYADGNWSEPLNMGSDLNTAGAEASVFLAADGKTLYFSSNGHAGFGDLDMFMSKRLDNTWKHWSTPVNLGNRINTPGMDVYYTIPASGDYAYYSSERAGYGLNDIYRILLPQALRPDAVQINQAGLYANQAIQIPQLKPYQTPVQSDIDKRIEELKAQLQSNNTSSNTPIGNQQLDKINQQQSKLDEEMKKLESQYQALPPTTYSNNVPGYPASQYTPIQKTYYDPSYDNKINELKRKLELAKIQQPAVPTQVSTAQVDNNLQSYNDKLNALQQTPVAPAPSTTNTTANSYATRQALNPYEEKLKKLQEELNQKQAAEQPAQIQTTPVNVNSNTSESTSNTPAQSDHTTTSIANPTTVNTPTKSTSYETQKALSPLEEKLKKLQKELKQSQKETAQEPVRISNPTRSDSTQTDEFKQPETTSSTVVQTSKGNTQTDTTSTLQIPTTTNDDFQKWLDQKKALEDSLQALESQKAILVQNNSQAAAQTQNILEEQKDLLDKKDSIAIAISQMQLEKEQLQKEKEKLERERKNLDLLKNQQYRDINNLKRQLDSLQALKNSVSNHIPAVTPNIDVDLTNMKKEVGEKITLKNVYFVVNASFIQEKSYADLDRLAVYLIKNSNLFVEVGGHTNGLCDDAFCNQLSEKRAKSVRDYLVTKGVPVNRLSYKGYGKTQNIADNNTEDGRKLNQRVEITITKVE